MSSSNSMEFQSSESSQHIDIMKLNLIIHARCSRPEFAQLILQRNCKNLTERFHIFPKTQKLDRKVKKMWNLLFAGYIREIQSKNNIFIPSAVAQLLKNCIKIGAADFFCDPSHNNPDDMTYLIWYNDQQFFFRCGNKTHNSYQKFPN